MMNFFARFQDRRRAARLAESLAKAASDGDVAATIALLDGGVGVNADWNGLTALQAAAMEGRSGLVRELIGRGADVDARDPEHDVTTLMQAAESGSVGTVRLLLAGGADVRPQDWMGRTALDYAGSAGAIAEMIRSAGAQAGYGSRTV